MASRLDVILLHRGKKRPAVVPSVQLAPLNSWLSCPLFRHIVSFILRHPRVAPFHQLIILRDSSTPCMCSRLFESDDDSVHYRGGNMALFLVLSTWLCWGDRRRADDMYVRMDSGLKGPKVGTRSPFVHLFSPFLPETEVSTHYHRVLRYHDNVVANLYVGPRFATGLEHFGSPATLVIAFKLRW